MLDSESNQLTKFRTKNWVEINDESRGTYTTNDNRYKTTMLRSSLFDYADAYILAKGPRKITGNAQPEPDPTTPRIAAQLLAARQANKRDKSVIFKNCASFTKCISRINNTDIDNAKDADIVMPMYNLIEYSDNYSKTSGNTIKIILIIT